ncbi:conserved hypothetical protein [Candidatus Desulfarcum epimagneticum]|uniref:Uncharacterized protein n=1 Tax=uncultured Desulfobacteraceae bacterium TaxID=218296 RepID=A0A484HIW9_9BACT|nr:conserved hypothetical protein [uncultured Desulfobacteraceae bacterium]
MGFSESVKAIAQDLTSLEVNTIIKHDMTGRKMPKPRHALIDIAESYLIKLADMGFPVETGSVRPGSFDSFDQIREKAAEGILKFKKKASRKPLDDEQESDLVLLHRIKRMSDQIKGLMKSFEKRGVAVWNNDISRADIENQAPDLPLATEELVLIRKIWDMGLEHIAMQTVIQMDGDVITRIQARYADKDSKVIHSIHNQSVSVSLKFWGQLVRILKDILGLFFK